MPRDSVAAPTGEGSVVAFHEAFTARAFGVTMMVMDLAAFRASLSLASAPSTLSPALRALWLDARGDWDGAHDAAQADEGGAGDWVHAYLHRKEGVTPAMPPIGTAAPAGRSAEPRSTRNGRRSRLRCSKPKAARRRKAPRECSVRAYPCACTSHSEIAGT